MGKFVTFVIRMPEDQVAKQQVSEAMKVLEPFRTAMALEGLCCTNQQQDELPQSPDGLIPCGPFAACPVL